MRYRFIRHALNRMREHGLSREEVVAFLDAAEWGSVEIDAGKEYHSAWCRVDPARWRRGRGGFLLIVYVDEEDGRVIITVGLRQALPPGALPL